MNVNELYDLGNKAYDEGRFEDALKYFQQAAPEHLDSASFIPLCYLNLASDISMDASNHADDTERLVRGQQTAVKILDLAVRSGLDLIRKHPDCSSACNVAATVIAQSLGLQYTLVGTGLTTAYRLTTTTTTIEKTMMGDTTLWEEVVGTETNSYVSLTSFDMSDYHIFGPDEKTKRVREEKEKILRNTIQAATILEYLNKEYDAHIVRASVACEMADCDGGDRSMLLPAGWFIAKAKELAKAAMTDDEYSEWQSLHAATTDSYNELTMKYDALLRSFRKEGQKPYLSKFYQSPEAAPAVESCQAYIDGLEADKLLDAELGKGDFFKVFLSVFAQVSFMKIFPTILFASIIGLFCGGLFHIFSPDAGIFVKAFGIVWLILTVILTFIRTLANGDEFRTTNSFRIYMAIMFGAMLLFSINFFVGLAAYIVLTVLSKKYK